MILQLARRMDTMKGSDVREILKVTQQAEVISFAGGLPAPELFPIDAIKHVAQLVLEEQGAQALQYSTTEGYLPLRQWVANRMNTRLGTSFDEDNILITQGSQQALDLSGKVFLDEGDVVFCESPTYLAAISAFRSYGCSFVEIPTDDFGMDIDALEKAIVATPKAKLIYIVPDFQNPTGNTWSLERRKGLAEVSNRHSIPVIEDNPYGELRFEGEFLPAAKSFDRAGSMFCVGSFSKIFCPGYRIAWIAGAKEIIAKYVLAKQSVDLQTNTLAQIEISRFLDLYDLDEHIEKIRATYRSRRDIMLSAMKKEFPKNVKFVFPQGGLFTWVELPEHINAREVLIKSIEKNVAFVPGGSFFPNSSRENTLRMNFSNMPEERIVEGVKRLGAVLREFV